MFMLKTINFDFDLFSSKDGYLLRFDWIVDYNLLIYL